MHKPASQHSLFLKLPYFSEWASASSRLRSLFAEHLRILHQPVILEHKHAEEFLDFPDFHFSSLAAFLNNIQVAWQSVWKIK